jgi:hypothetical protein
MLTIIILDELKFSQNIGRNFSTVQAANIEKINILVDEDRLILALATPFNFL